MSNRIKGSVTLRRLVMDVDLVRQQQEKAGRKQSLAILFSDIRGFTNFSERHLLYNVIHIINRYFQEVRAAVLEHQGYIDKYIGDGLMALFGVNQYLKQNFDESFEIGISIHFASVVLGNIGHHDKVQYIAIGDTVNIASRINLEKSVAHGF